MRLDTYSTVYQETYIRTALRLVEAHRGTPAELKQQVHTLAVAAAVKAALYDDIPKWGLLRTLIYKRDRGICAVCGDHIHKDDYDLGHLQDRCAGGLDIPENLVAMCGHCNRISKPVHSSIAAARAWLAEGHGWRVDVEQAAARILARYSPHFPRESSMLPVAAPQSPSASQDAAAAIDTE